MSEKKKKIDLLIGADHAGFELKESASTMSGPLMANRWITRILPSKWPKPSPAAG
jgi:hypothetical protein